jgi:tripartite-type tricarboxylate transporter receptor subunit TctC
MSLPWYRAAVACVALAASGSVSATRAVHAGDEYPSRPVKIVSQAAAGSALDIFGRIIAEYLAKSWRSGVVIENRPGAGGRVAAQSVIGGAKDGYTLLHAAASLFTISAAESDKPAFDVNRDLIPVAHLGELPLLIAVPKSLGIESLAELIAQAKREPGKLNIGTNGAGSFPHLAAILFTQQAEAPMTLVPYARGGAPAILNDLLGNRIHVTVEAVSGVKGALESGQLKALAIMASARQPAFPNLPTVGEEVPGFTAVGWSILAAPRGTPAPVVAKIEAAVRAALGDPTVRQRLADLGVYPRSFSPDELAAFIEAEQRTWWPQVRAHAAATEKSK